MVVVQSRDVSFDRDSELPEVEGDASFGDDSVEDSSWEEFSSNETALDALAGFIAAVNSEQGDDVGSYYRVIDTQTGEIRGI